MNAERKVGVEGAVLEGRREETGVRAKVHFSLPGNHDFG